MKNNNFKSVDKRIKNICFCALLSALICVCTLISVPLPIGYFNLGDTMIITGAWLLGPLWGAIAAAIGSAIADLIMGFAIYAPATALIKGAVALISFFVFRAFSKAFKSRKLLFIPRVTSSVIGEIFMVVGYLFFEAVILSYGAGAFASVFGNCLQGICGVVGSTILIGALSYTRISKLVSVNPSRN